MNQKSTYSQNFDKAIQKAMNCDKEDIETFKFRLTPIDEEKGGESSRDSWMKNTKLKNNKIEQLKSYDQAIWLLSAGDSKYPLWINISQINNEEVQLEFTTRFRHIKSSQNQETGHPPFKVIYKIDNLVEKTNRITSSLINQKIIKEITNDNLDSIVLPKEYILYFLVDWSGSERLSRYRVFNYFSAINEEITILFIDGTNQSRKFISSVSDKIGENLEMQYIGGHGTISFIRENKVLDEIKHPHTLDREKLEMKLTKWVKTIANT